MDADVIVVGAGLAGLVATHELTRRGKKVADILPQDNKPAAEAPAETVEA